MLIADSLRPPYLRSHPPRRSRSYAGIPQQPCSSHVSLLSSKTSAFTSTKQSTWKTTIVQSGEEVADRGDSHRRPRPCSGRRLRGAAERYTVRRDATRRKSGKNFVLSSRSLRVCLSSRGSEAAANQPVPLTGPALRPFEPLRCWHPARQVNGVVCSGKMAHGQDIRRVLQGVRRHPC
jgi:hypothetical protein